MTALFQPPLIPGLGNFTGGGPNVYSPNKSPFYSVSNQFLPRNLHDVIKWVRFITAQSPVTTEVLRKLATYPITSFTYSSDDPGTRVKYEKIVESLKLRTVLHDIGFQYFTVGNVFISLYLPIKRMIECPTCQTTYSATAKFLKFRAFTFTGDCPKCMTRNVTFIRKDVPSRNIDEMNIVVWDPTNITVNHNPISGKSKYFYTIPNEIKRQVIAGNPVYLDSLPWEFIESIQKNESFEFQDGAIYHMKNVDTGFSANGISVPPLISHFNLVFYQATLRRANETIATDFMSPLRVVFPQPQTGNSDPVMAASLRNFTSIMEQTITNHRRDNSHVLIAPMPIGYQAISGEGKTLLVAQEIREAEESLMLSLGVSRELLSGSTNWTSSTVGLRMLKNTLDSYVNQVQDLLTWLSMRTGRYLTIPNCRLGLTPFQLTDDETLKSILLELAKTGNVSMTTIYEAMGRSYDEEQDRMLQEAKSQARFQVRMQFEVDRAKYLESLELSKKTDKDSGYQEALSQANQMVSQLQTMAPEQAQMFLQELQIQDFSKYVLVHTLLEHRLTDPIQPGLSPQVGPDGQPVDGVGAGAAEPGAPGGAEGQDSSQDPDPSGMGGPSGDPSGQGGMPSEMNGAPTDDQGQVNLPSSQPKSDPKKTDKAAKKDKK